MHAMISNSNDHQLLRPHNEVEVAKILRSMQEKDAAVVADMIKRPVEKRNDLDRLPAKQKGIFTTSIDHSSSSSSICYQKQPQPIADRTLIGKALPCHPKLFFNNHNNALPQQKKYGSGNNTATSCAGATSRKQQQRQHQQSSIPSTEFVAPSITNILSTADSKETMMLRNLLLAQGNSKNLFSSAQLLQSSLESAIIYKKAMADLALASFLREEVAIKQYLNEIVASSSSNASVVSPQPPLSSSTPSTTSIPTSISSSPTANNNILAEVQHQLLCQPVSAESSSSSTQQERQLQQLPFAKADNLPMKSATPPLSSGGDDCKKQRKRPSSSSLSSSSSSSSLIENESKKQKTKANASSATAAKPTFQKPCLMESCIDYAVGRSVYCKKHSGKRMCEHKEKDDSGNMVCCTKIAQSRTRFCIRHGGGRRCTVDGCTKSARDKLYCAGHGGGKRCCVDGCMKLAVNNNNNNRTMQQQQQQVLLLCTAHGGGRRCQHVNGCTRSAQGNTPYCVRHGGGKQCTYGGCNKVARGRTKFCIFHTRIMNNNNTATNTNAAIVNTSTIKESINSSTTM